MKYLNKNPNLKKQMLIWIYLKKNFIFSLGNSLAKENLRLEERGGGVSASLS